VSVYPNPSNGIFTIQSSEENATVEVYTMLGEKISSCQMVSGKTDIDLSSRQAGIYLLKIKTNKGIVMKKIAILK
jgi:hypothetical protein